MSSYLSKLRSLPAEFRSSLKSFTSSSSSFKVVQSTSSHHVAHESLSSTHPDRLYVFDSSFNPPTRGHLDIALSALKSDASPSKHILLLLATQNADKAAKPAAFEQRLVMMNILADNLVHAFTDDPASSTADDPGPTPHPELTVHLGVVKHPYFIDKAQAIAGNAKSSSDVPSSPSSGENEETPFPFPPTRQTHLIGFDTFTRLFDPKYYEPSHGLKALAPLFDNHAVRVTLRTDDGFGSRQDQGRYVNDIGDGKREAEGADPAWAKKIELVEGINSKDGATSSTRAREAAKHDDRETLVKMCGEHVADWVLQERLYKD